MKQTRGATCYRITSENSNEFPSLQCNQEEADGRLLLHAAHAATEGYGAVVICSEDTDVFIMALAFHDKIGVPLFQRCGTKTRKRIIDIKRVASSVGLHVCRALIGMHAYTGCDTVSSFAGKGKAKALKILMHSRDYQTTFTELGTEWNVSAALFEKLEAFTCLLYATKVSSTNFKVNDLRYHLFCAKNGEIESHQLPPCRDCLVQHAQRANYQAAIWQRCLEHNAAIPSPEGRGWKIEREGNDVDNLVVNWMSGQPAPQAILDMLSCNCAKKCALPRCVCMANGLKCTDMCRLRNCDNQADDDGSTSELEEKPEEDFEY